MSGSLSLTVEVVSDVCCPWCYLGKRRLDAALEQLPDIAVDVIWRPFQLDPTIPRGGVDRKAYMARKFPDPARIADIHHRLEQLGAAAGIAYRFDDIRIAPNSLDAHRLLRWAGEAGVQGEMKERLLQLYWSEGADIGDLDVLAAAATSVGLDGGAIRQRLAGDDDRATVAAEIAHLQRIGVSGVPTFILDGKYAVSGAQEVSTLVAALRDVAEEKAFGPKA